MDYGQYLATLGEGTVHASNKKIFSLSFSKDFSLSLSLLPDASMQGQSQDLE